jgi:hypothetical protein
VGRALGVASDKKVSVESTVHTNFYTKSGLFFTAPSQVKLSTAETKSLKNLKTKKCLRPQMDFITLCTTVGIFNKILHVVCADIYSEKSTEDMKEPISAS